MIESVGSQLKLLRTKRGLSLSAVCSLAGISKSTLSSWENDEKSPSPAALLKVFDVIRADPIDSARIVQLSSPQALSDWGIKNQYPTPVAIGDLLRTFRVQAKLRQSEIANRLKVSQSAVAKWESGESRPDLPTLSKIALLYNLGPMEQAVLQEIPLEIENDGQTFFDRLTLINRLPIGLQEASYLCLARESWLQAIAEPVHWGAYVITVGCLINFWVDEYQFAQADQAVLPTMNVITKYGLWEDGYLAFFRGLQSKSVRQLMPYPSIVNERKMYASNVKNTHIRNYLLSAHGSPSQNASFRAEIEATPPPTPFRLHKIDPVEIDLLTSSQLIANGDPETAIGLLRHHMSETNFPTYDLWVDSPNYAYCWACTEANLIPHNFDKMLSTITAAPLTKTQVKSWEILRKRVDRLRKSGAEQLSSY